MSISNDEHIAMYRFLSIEPSCSTSGISCAWEIFNQIHSPIQDTDTSILQGTGNTFSSSLTDLGTELQSMWHEKTGQNDSPFAVTIKNPQPHGKDKKSPISQEQMSILCGTILYKFHPRKIFLPT